MTDAPEGDESRMSETIRSMTGYGRAQDTVDGLAVTVELRSVNHRFFEYASRLPRGYAFLDPKLKALIQRRVGRGKLDVSVQIDRLTALGFGNLPVCIAKTQFSFSADAKQYGAVSGFNILIKDVVLNAGAEMIVAIAGDILRMPGLPKDPQANHIDYVDGEIIGLS